MNNYALLNYNATEIRWDGPNIPCIGVCQGDMISDIVFKIAKRVCEIVDDLNSLKDLDLSCLLQHCENCDEDKSLKHIVQLLFNNDCSLKELIDDLVDLANDKSELVLKLDLTCLKTCSSYSDITPDNFNCNSPIAIIEDCTEFAGIPYTECECSDQDFINDCGETVPYTLNELLQYLIDRLCCQSSIIAQMETRITGLEEDYAEIISTLPTIYQEPILTTCINPTGRIHSLVSASLANYTCSLRANLGTTSDVNLALSKQCIEDYVFLFEGNEDGVLIGANQIVIVAHGFVVGQQITYHNNGNPNIGGMVDGTTYYVKTVVDPDTITLSAFVTLIPTLDLTSTSVGSHSFTLLSINPNAINLAQNSFNQWSVLCDVWSRLTAIKTGSCCLPDCKDIKVGFQYVYIEDENIYQLIFNSDYGTKIPTGWVDCGSKITVEDWKGIYFTFDIEIVNSFTFDLELTGLDLSHPISVNIKTCFTHEETSINCKECLGYTFPAIPSSCDYCKICAGATNPTDQIKVSYYTADNLNVRYSILSPGTCLTFKMPEESPTITSVVILTIGSDIELFVDPSSECVIDLPIPVAVENTCWLFNLPMSYGFQEAIKKAMVSGIVALGTPQVGVGNVDMDLVSDTANVLEYLKIKTTTSPSYLNISGKTLNLSQVGTDYIIASANTPTVAIGTEIVEKTTCGAGYDIIWDASSPFTDASGESVGIGSVNFPTLGLAPKFGGGGFSAFNIPVLIQANGGSPAGMSLILKITGQSPEEIPILVVKDPITSVEMSIYGEFLDECTCPS